MSRQSFNQTSLDWRSRLPNVWVRTSQILDIESLRTVSSCFTQSHTSTCLMILNFDISWSLRFPYQMGFTFLLPRLDPALRRSDSWCWSIPFSGHYPRWRLFRGYTCTCWSSCDFVLPSKPFPRQKVVCGPFYSANCPGGERWCFLSVVELVVVGLGHTTHNMGLRNMGRHKIQSAIVIKVRLRTCITIVPIKERWLTSSNTRDWVCLTPFGV